MIRRVMAALLMLGWATMGMAGDDRSSERAGMVRDVEALVASLADELGRKALDRRVLEALARVPRHEFVPPEESHAAYRNRPLPIGHGQTISQPFIVALMTDLLNLTEQSRVLEIGTGSGYQAAVLSLLAKEVYSIEIVEPLGVEAAATLRRLGYANVSTRIGDGYEGWPEAAPFDAIIVTAAPDHVPPRLVEQLRPGGRMVIPVGGDSQDLMVVVKAADGRTTASSIIPVRFVPLTRTPAD